MAMSMLKRSGAWEPGQRRGYVRDILSAAEVGNFFNNRSLQLLVYWRSCAGAPVDSSGRGCRLRNQVLGEGQVGIVALALRRSGENTTGDPKRGGRHD